MAVFFSDSKKNQMDYVDSGWQCFTHGRYIRVSHLVGGGGHVDAFPSERAIAAFSSL